VLQAQRRRLERAIGGWIRRRQGEDRLPLVLARRRIYILPTRAGLGFGLLLLLMLLAGLNYANSLALLTTFLLAGVALVSLNQCHRNLQGVRVVNLHAPPAFAGDPVLIDITLEPQESTRYAIRVEAGNESILLPELQSNSTTRGRLALRPAARGLLHIERVRIATRFPFGLARAWCWLYLPLAITIYPRAEGSLPLPSAAQGREGGATVAAAGHDEWYGLRPFRDGDSPRQVAWKVYARGLPLLVKEYRGAASDSLWFDFDVLAPLPVEARLEQLARWVVEAERRGARYALRLQSIEIDLDAGEAHRDRCLGALARYGAPAAQR